MQDRESEFFDIQRRSGRRNARRNGVSPVIDHSPLKMPVTRFVGTVSRRDNSTALTCRISGFHWCSQKSEHGTHECVRHIEVSSAG
jgi:hypothetical protein